MEYKKLTESFLNTCTPTTATEYRYKLKIFHDFLAVHKNMDDTNYFYIMSAMTPQDIIDSVAYYIENCAVKFKLTIDVYFFAVASFFDYLHLSKHIDNEMFSKKQNRLELKQSVDKAIEQHGLKAKQIFPPLTDDEIDALIDKCNEILNDNDSDKFMFTEQQKYNRQFSLFMSAIIVKIIIFTGVTNDTLLSMKTSHVDVISGKLKLNGYWIHLPDALSQQMKLYMTIREKIVRDDKNTLLFFSPETSKKTNNSQMLKVLSELLGHNRAMSIAKHSIIRKLEVGMSSEMLMDFTGYSGDVMGHCLEIYHDQLGISAQKAIDVGVHADRYFDNL